jgi:hypothetical protein
MTVIEERMIVIEERMIVIEERMIVRSRGNPKERIPG